MTNKSRKEYAYTVLDVEGEVSADVEEKIRAIDGVRGVRVIK